MSEVTEPGARQAVEGTETTPGSSEQIELEQRRLELEKQKLNLQREGSLKQIELEQKRLKLEGRKLDLERTAGRRDLWKTILTLLTIVAGVGVGLSQLNAARESQRFAERQQERMKLAELVLSDRNPHEMADRIAILKDILGADFAGHSFDADKYVGVTNEADKWSFLNLIAAHPEQEARIIRLWRMFWPCDYERWLCAVEDACGELSEECKPEPL